MNEDRHRASYIPFRCSQETSELITQLAHEEHRPKSEVLRDLVDKGLVASGLKADEDYLEGIVRRTVQEVVKPHVERLAAISAKATQISGAAFFMGCMRPCCAAALQSSRRSRTPPDRPVSWASSI